MSEYAAHSFAPDSELDPSSASSRIDDATPPKTFYADMKFHDVRAEMRRRKYKTVRASELKSTSVDGYPATKLGLLWRNYRNIPFDTLDMGIDGAGSKGRAPRVLLANHIENAHLLTRKASLSMYLNKASSEAGGQWLAECFPRTLVVTARPRIGSDEELPRPGTGELVFEYKGSSSTITCGDKTVELDPSELGSIRCGFLSSAAHCVIQRLSKLGESIESAHPEAKEVMSAARLVAAADEAILTAASPNGQYHSLWSAMQLLQSVFEKRSVVDVMVDWGVSAHDHTIGLSITGSGLDNVWIVKPSTLSRGRGITVVATFYALLRAICESATPDAASSKRKSRIPDARYQVVVQKYIERPLLLPMRVLSSCSGERRLSSSHLCKFDIRVWVLITSLYLKSDVSEQGSATDEGRDSMRSCEGSCIEVRVFDPPYLRLCSRPYDICHSAESLSDPLMQLTNNSVQGRRPKSNADGIERNETGDTQSMKVDAEIMWSTARFARFLRDGICESVQEEPLHNYDPCPGGPWSQHIFPQIKRLCAAAVRSIRDQLKLRKHFHGCGASSVTGFEWLGLDFMLDAELNPMLIEANLDPDMSHSTQVTKALVPKAVNAALDIVLPQGAAPGGSEHERGDGTPTRELGEWMLVERM